MEDFLTYEQVDALKKGDRIQFWYDIIGIPSWHTGTIASKTTLLGSSSLWIQLDGGFDGKGLQLNVITGMDLKKGYWENSKYSRQFKFAPMLSHTT